MVRRADLESLPEAGDGLAIALPREQQQATVGPQHRADLGIEVVHRVVVRLERTVEVPRLPQQDRHVEPPVLVVGVLETLSDLLDDVGVTPGLEQQGLDPSRPLLRIRGTSTVDRSRRGSVELQQLLPEADSRRPAASRADG
jgi:hypothetical protein